MNESDPLLPGDAAPMEIPASARRLLRVVYIMGVVLVLLFLTLIAAIIWKSNHKATPAAIAAPQTLNLGLPQGSEIRSASLDGDRLVVTTATQVIVVDIRKNTILSRLQVAP